MRPQNDSATDTKPKNKSSVKNDDRVNDRVSDRVNFAAEVLSLVEKNPGLRSKDLAALAGKSIPTISRFLKGMKADGKIERRGDQPIDRGDRLVAFFFRFLFGGEISLAEDALISAPSHAHEDE